MNSAQMEFSWGDSRKNPWVSSLGDDQLKLVLRMRQSLLFYQSCALKIKCSIASELANTTTPKGQRATARKGSQQRKGPHTLTAVNATPPKGTSETCHQTADNMGATPLADANKNMAPKHRCSPQVWRKGRWRPEKRQMLQD